MDDNEAVEGDDNAMDVIDYTALHDDYDDAEDHDDVAGEANAVDVNVESDEFNDVGEHGDAVVDDYDDG